MDGDAWTAFVATALEAYGATQHMLGPQLATVEGDSAHCRTDVQALHYLKARADTTLTLWATYETDMQRIDGEWKIKRHTGTQITIKLWQRRWPLLGAVTLLPRLLLKGAVR